VVARISPWHVVAVALYLSFALTLGTQPVAANNNQVVVAQLRDADILDPALTGAAQEVLNILINIFDTLVTLDENLQIRPSLATEWQVDGTRWVFKLREGVRFHNGDVLDAHAVKFTLERNMDPTTNSPQATRLSAIRGVNVLDDYTLEIITHEPYPALLNILAGQFIVPPRAVQEMGRDFGLSPVGSGPFRFVQWDMGQQIVLEANDDYWYGRPYIDRLIFRPLQETSTRIAAFLAGEVDVAATIPPDRMNEIRNSPRCSLRANFGTQLYLGLPTLDGPFAKREVRQAVNHAIDVDLIIDELLNGTAKRMNGPIFENAIGYDATLPAYPYDPDRARELLHEAGYADGFETTLHYVAAGMEGITNLQEVAEIIAAMLGELESQVVVCA